jgi:NADH-quinone oxidoreductase subunit G
VQTQTPEVVEARASVLEFLLINHPLDCPVCDKGGECPLQDFSYSLGPNESRMEFPRRVFDGEGVKADVDFGPTLMLNRNRCILCTRCVRFMKEVDADAQINIVDRGNGSEIATFQEEGVHSLLSGNLMDVCPVGAITTKDYRFKSRPWDNPNAVDTICTLCSKGCSTTMWLKAKPEWAKGSRLIRVTPRMNPEVNGYWMCDIGRFDYHWIESDDRLRQPLIRDAHGVQQPASWRDLLAGLRARLVAAGTANPEAVRFLLSAHASHEEFFLFRRLAEGLVGHANAISVTWHYQPKPQPDGAKFKVPPVDAPNVNGAKLFGLVNGGLSDEVGEADISALKEAVARGDVSALYVFDPGPETLGDSSWITEARALGTLPLLMVQGVLLSPLARAADFVLPGASFVEKEASYTNDQGRLQGAARVIPVPGEVMEDWQILVTLASELGLAFDYSSATQVRADIAARHADRPELAGISELAFAGVVTARHWLEASNPSERWKWDVMFQDLPPIKGSVEPSALPPAPGVIPLREVKP